MKILQQLEAIIRTPAVRAALAEAATQEVNRRAALVQQLQEAAAAHAGTTQAAQRQAESARALVAKRAAALTEAQAAFDEVRRISLNSSVTFDALRDQITRKLAESADPRIDLFIEDCRRGFQRGCGAAGDYDRVAKAMIALRGACEAAEALKLAPLTPEQVTEALVNIARELEPVLAGTDLFTPAVEPQS